MRNKFDDQLLQLNKKMIEMGALCERFIDLASNAVLSADIQESQEILEHGHEIDELEKEIENICLKLLLQQQPVASDLRQISGALKMITDMERIGDQAEDIAEIIPNIAGRTGKEFSDFKLMAQTACKMVRDSIEAFVKKDLALAKTVASQDDIVDQCFVNVKNKLIEMISNDSIDGEYAIDLLMIAKYFERIGDHANNITEWVEYSITGIHPTISDSLVVTKN